MGGSLRLNDDSSVENVLTTTDQGDGAYVYSYVATLAGVYTLTPTVLDDPVKDAPFTVVVREGEPAPACFVWEGLVLDASGACVLVAGRGGTCTLFAHDRHGNRVHRGGLALTGSLTGSADVDVIVHDAQDGSYALTYTPTKAGVYALRVIVHDVLVGGAPNPSTIVCIPAEAHPPSSIAEGDGISTAVAGQASAFVSSCSLSSLACLTR